jgi:hypothetical protein
MKIKKQIRITYLVDLDTDNIESIIERGVNTIDGIKVLLNKFDLNRLYHSGIIRDYEVESVEDIEEA